MQKYIIFNKYNKITIVKNGFEKIKFQQTKLINCFSNNLSSIDFFQYFKEECKDDIILVANDVSIEDVFKYAIKGLKFVLAAGGVVENEQDEVLFMFRNGEWDLPKGHWEQGETIQTTAKREVMEECGMKILEEKEFLAKTYHTYVMNGVREIKETSWYRMFCLKQEKLIPQTIEGIDKLVWVKKDKIQEILEKSYPSIQQLFKEISL
ncbi:MAG: NUDIX domain-containing protein [Bacteroidales bacterium]|jgi:8-oxo-dGTP pyrophosphatase MutT (NUDIX family)|nr:NUDIX domain-containing protein [Bacteroidales bacterium]